MKASVRKALLMALVLVFVISMSACQEPVQPEHEHALQHVEVKEATCSTDGVVEHWVCSECGKKFSDENATAEVTDTVIPAAHTGGVEIRNEKAPTVEEEGYSGDTYCLGCGEKIADGASIDKLTHAHSLEQVTRVEATCSTDGTVEHWVCSECGKKFSDENATAEVTDTVIPAAHTGGVGIRNEKTPTVEEEGYSGDTYCLGCGDTLSYGVVLPCVDKLAPAVVANYTVTGENTVQVVISIVNNPGIMSLKFDVLYDTGLTLQTVEFADAFGAYVSAPKPFINPQTVNWMSPAGNMELNGEFVTFTFAVDPEVPAGTTMEIRLILDDSNIFGADMNRVHFESIGTTVTVE